MVFFFKVGECQPTDMDCRYDNNMHFLKVCSESYETALNIASEWCSKKYGKLHNINYYCLQYESWTIEPIIEKMIYKMFGKVNFAVLHEN